MMRRISLSLLSATAMGLIASQAAWAADLGHPVLKAPPPAPPPVQDWSGIYVGLEAGYGWGKQNFSAFDPFGPASRELNAECIGPGGGDKACGPNAAISSVSQSGWLAGGFVGAQKQWGSWVLGIEADFDAADIKGTTTASASFTHPIPVDHSLVQSHTFNSKIDELGTVRGKVGWAWSPNWMIYGTGGLALAHSKSDFSASQSFCVSGSCSADFDTGFNIGGISGSAGTTMFGWTVGAGLDYKWQLDQGSAVIFGVEYLHYQFDDHSVTFGPSINVDSVASIPFTPSIGNMNQTIDVIKGRISYLFSIH
jgi:outer membrane immunogenic protein